MPIQIIDGFKVKDYLPIDDRIVASSSRINISYKYDGLRVWDLSDQIPYVWINGKWQKENLNSVIFYGKVKPGFTQSSFNGLAVTTSNLLKVWNSETNELINSNITESIYNKKPTVGINFGGKLPDFNSTLDVNGGLSSNGFTGNGSGITDLNASEIKSGKLSIKSIKPGLEGQILISKNGIAKWEYSDNVEFTYSSSITTNTFDKEYQMLLKGDDNKFYSSNNIIYNANQILLKENPNGASNTPNYSFVENPNTGVYLESNKISFSVDGDKKLTIDSYGIKSLDKFSLGNDYSIIKLSSDTSFSIKSKTSLKVGSSISLPSIIKFYDVDTEYRMTDTEINILYNKMGFKLTRDNLDNIGEFTKLSINGLGTLATLSVGTFKISYETKSNFQNLLLNSENGYTFEGEKFKFTKNSNSYFNLSDKIYYNDKYYLSFNRFVVPKKINTDSTIRARNILSNNDISVKTLNINNNNIQTILFCKFGISIQTQYQGSGSSTIDSGSSNIINTISSGNSLAFSTEASLPLSPNKYSQYRILKINFSMTFKSDYQYIFNSKNIFKLRFIANGGNSSAITISGGTYLSIYRTNIKVNSNDINIELQLLYNDKDPGMTYALFPVNLRFSLMIISKTK